MADETTGDFGSGVTGCNATNEMAPPLLVDPGVLMTYGFYASCLVLVLMFIHYIQPLAREAKTAFKAEQQRDTEGGLAPAETFEAQVFNRSYKFTAKCWFWMRRLDWPWLEAEFEGDAFYNFVITLILESVLNATNTANTHLEGDLEFSNDPTGTIVVVSWLLSGMEVLSIIVLITEIRRSR